MIDEHSACEIECREEVEIRGETEVVRNRRRYETANEVARDIASDVGGEGATGVGCAALLAQICKRERKGRCHANALRDAQRSEGGEIRCNREQRGRDREGGQADQDAKPAVDTLAEQGDDQAGHRHAHGARIHRKAHGRWRDLIGPCQRRKNCLRCKEIHDREKRTQADYDRA